MKRIRTTILLVLLALVLSPSCKRAELQVPAVQKLIIFEAGGGTVFASILASGAFSASSDADWCYVEAYDHKWDNLRISIEANSLASDREATVTLTMEGAPEQTLTVHQFASEPFVTAVTRSVILDANTVAFEVTVSSNTEYSYTLPTWVKDAAPNSVGTGTCTYYFVADALGPGGERSAEIVFTAISNPSLRAPVSVLQTNDVLPLLDDDFAWCTGTADAVGSTSGEIRFDNLPATEGWTSEPVSGNYNCWARSGCMRFSRTGAGGILVSPPLRAINGTANVKVSFQAARWCNASGLHDDNYVFTVQVRGGGTPSQTSFEITCDYASAGWQSEPSATHSFVIEGATASTQIVWISSSRADASIPSSDGNGDGTASTVGRLLLDNVKVEYN